MTRRWEPLATTALLGGLLPIIQELHFPLHSPEVAARRGRCLGWAEVPRMEGEWLVMCGGEVCREMDFRCSHWALGGRLT